MKRPPTFSTGDPSYFVVISTSGSVSPIALTIAKEFAAVDFVGLWFIESNFLFFRSGASGC
jgi:hypothetical protein